MNVLITVDTEIWCGGWTQIDAKFPDAFDKYIIGKTAGGNFGLPFMLRTLQAHALKAVFFVEPLFALRFGIAPLQEIVKLIQSYGQTVELHLHTEWLDEAHQPIVTDTGRKRAYMKDFSYEDQLRILQTGADLLKQAGVQHVRAFRAGSFGANDDTLKALLSTGIATDSSFNPAAEDCAISDKALAYNANQSPLNEVPMTTFTDGLGKLRPTAITACSSAEMLATLRAAYAQNRRQFVILTHPFELLNVAKTRKNSVVIRRFNRLCRFLADHRDQYVTTDFRTAQGQMQKDAILKCPFTPTMMRVGEQVLSRLQ